MLRTFKNSGLLSLSAAVFLALSGCAQPVIVQPGDRVEMSFTCHLPGGKLAVTTRPDSEVAGEVKSPLYLERTGPETVSVQAAETARIPGVQSVKVFELEVVELLAPHTVGARVEERKSIVIAAPRYTGLPRDEEYISIARIRHCPKVLRVKSDEYTARTGLKAEVGQPYIIDPAIPGTVSEVTGQEVVVRFTAQAGGAVTTPFGNGVIRETDSEYSYGINAVKDTLVRTVDMVGRIVEVSEDSIGLDYGHPFGGATLRCDMTVNSVETSAKADAPVREIVPVTTGNIAQPSATREEKLQGILTDALAKGTKGGAVIDNLDKEVAACGAETATAACSGESAGLSAGDLPWQEQHDVGLARAKADGKPAVLVLHADWCGYCKKLFNETMPDPRISSLRDKFTWIRVNSDKLTDIKKLYGQEGYPMIVVFRADGTLARKLDGFQEAAALWAALQEVL